MAGPIFPLGGSAPARALDAGKSTQKGADLDINADSRVSSAMPATAFLRDDSTPKRRESILFVTRRVGILLGSVRVYDVWLDASGRACMPSLDYWSYLQRAIL